MNDSSLSSESTISPGEADAADESFIAVRSLWKVFGKNPERALGPEYADRNRAAIQEELGCLVALRDVSFDVPKGQTFVVMGLSGSGKSTLVRCLTRLIEPTAGTVEVGSEDVTGMSDNELTEFRRKSVAMVFQHYGLMPHRNVIDNASWGLEVRGTSKKDRHARSREVLELVGLRDWEEAYPSQLSGGMQQRVGLARALVVDPDILLMDEPFSGLDPLIRRQMQDELLRLQAELQKTIVFITHDLNEALKLGDRIAIMHDGQVAQIGSPEDIVLRPVDEYVGEFTQDVRLESVLTANAIMVAPKATLQGYQGPRAALHTIGESDGDAAWVVDTNEQYIGLLSITSAQEALRAGVRRFDQAWQYIDRDYAAVPPETTFDQLIPAAMASDFPIPIVNNDNTLVGEVHRSALAKAIAETATVKPEPATS